MEESMTEPHTTAGAIAAHKAFLFSLPLISFLLAFWLGLRYAPLHKDAQWKDLVDRLAACVVSSFVCGVPAVLALMHYYPEVFAVASQLALVLGVAPNLGSVAGVVIVSAWILPLCSLPGPWLFAAIYLWLKRQKGKDAAEILKRVRGK
ncbi:hypothetical protein ACLBKS_15740 [Hylemonella sp. W303a]|uniref:hypothetical protein n=1 Tax=Hylemonella sp. W303a TaxID=3389873 RepID=UPI00396B081D